MSILEAFRVEAGEHLENAERSLMRVVGSVGDFHADIGEIFRAVHTIKGSAGYVGHAAALTLSHAFESVLETLRCPEAVKPTEPQIDVFFQALDALKALIQDAETSVDSDVSTLAESLCQLREALEVSSTVPIARKVMTEDDVFQVCVEQQLIAINAALSKIEVGNPIPDLTRAMLQRAAETLVNASAYAGHEAVEAAASSLVTSIKRSQDTLPIQADLEQLSEIVANLVSSVRHALGGSASEVSAVPKSVAVASQTASTGAGAKDAVPNGSSLVKVDRDHLDGFLNLVGELIVTRNAFGHILGELAGSDDKRSEALKSLRKTYGMLRHISERMQDGAMNMKMIPVDVIFRRYPKLARDLSRKLAKDVRVVLDGEQTRIDRSIADELSDPILHLVRNAIDHGIESPEARQRSGKDGRACIFLTARQEHQNIVIEVRDDGAGMDLKRIRAKAVERGLVTAAASTAMTDAQAIDLIFLPGFSTACEVSEVSGRGVGLDVVKRNIEKLNGQISVATEPGKGTTMRLVVPLTMAVMNAVLVSVRQKTYAIPVNAIREVLKVPRAEIRAVGRGHVFSLREEIIGLRRLADILGEDCRKDDDAAVQTIVVVATASGKIGLAIDAVHRNEEIVVKTLQSEVAGSAAIMGASLLGDGSAILILDPKGLVNLSIGNGHLKATVEGDAAHG